MNRCRIFFRRTKFNAFTLPILLHVAEKNLFSHDADIVLANSQVDILEGCSKNERSMACYSFMTPELESVLSEVSLLRKMRPEILLVAGGPHPSADPEGTLNMGFDAVFTGEGEDCFGEYLRRFSQGLIEVGIKEIIYPSGPVEIDDSFPFSEIYNLLGPIEITRGCPFACTYCQTPRLFSMPIRHRSINSLVKFLDIMKGLGRSQIRFLSPNALSYGSSNPRRPNCKSLRELLSTSMEKGGTHIVLGTFPSEVRPDSITPEAIEILSQFCSNHTIVIGAQTGSRRLLQSILRGHDPEDVLNGISIVTGYGFRAHVDFMFGLPGENDQDRKESIELMKILIRRYRAKIHAHVFLPLPGTPLSKESPSPLEPPFVTLLKRFEHNGVLDGEWERQIELQGKIKKWRTEGLILT